MNKQSAPFADRTVGDIVAARPNLSRVFQAFDIGFCCQGKLTLRQACERNKAALEEVVAALEKELESADAPQENPASLSLAALAAYIVERHHGYLRRELPRIYSMAERVAQVRGERAPSLVEVYEVFAEMGRELAEHARKEELILFPAIAELDREGAGATDIGGPVSCMMEDHESTDAALAKLRELTNGYQPPADACNTWRALFAGLAELEADLVQHIHLENNILFPRALERAS